MPYRPTFKSRSDNIGSNPSALLEQAIPSYKDRPYNTVLSPSTLPTEKDLIRLAVRDPSQRAAAEALEEYGGGGLRHRHY